MALHLWVATAGTVLALGNTVGGLHLTGQLSFLGIRQEVLRVVHRLNGALTLALFVVLGYLSTAGGPASSMELGVLVLGLVAYGGKVVVVSVLNRAYLYGGGFGFLIMLTWVAALLISVT